MKRSKVVNIVLVSSLFTACSNDNTKTLFVRTDTTAEYTVVQVAQNEYIYFEPYDIFTPEQTRNNTSMFRYYNGYYESNDGKHYRGYHSEALSHHSSSYNNHVTRSGFGTGRGYSTGA